MRVEPEGVTLKNPVRMFILCDVMVIDGNVYTRVVDSPKTVMKVEKREDQQSVRIDFGGVEIIMGAS